MWKVKVENIDSRHSITPDYKVSMTIKDYIDKKDVIVTEGLRPYFKIITATKVYYS